MGMSIRNNLSALNINNTMNKNASSLAKSLKHVSGGEKISGAADDASCYAISEKMRVLIRGLNQDRSNVQTGTSLLRVAEGGIQSIVEELRTLKELAINSANDHNTDSDRAIIQKEFDQRRLNINDIADSTNYNGKLLLNGRYGRGKTSVEIPSGATTQPTVPAGSTTMISSVGASGTSLATFTISSDGVYQLDAGCKNCRIVINAENVELVGSGGTNTNVFVECKKENTNLWLNNYNVFSNRTNPDKPDYSMDISLIRFGAGDNNTLNIVGTNTVYTNDTTFSYSPILLSGAPKTATINVGGGLSIWGDGTLGMYYQSTKYGATIGADSGEYSNANIVINSGNITVGSANGACIGSGAEGGIGNIVINGGSVSGTSWGQAVIGTGGGGTCGNIIVNGGTVQGRNVYARRSAIGGGEDGNVGNITFRGGSIHVNNATSDYSGEATDVIGGGIGGSCGAITAPGTFSNNNHNYDQDLPDVEMQESDLERSIPKGEELVIQTGTKAAQAIHVYINSMHTWDMGIDKAAVTNQQKANSAISMIDDALNYVLDEITYVGAYISRLEYTESNIVTATENTQASESALRDADMAKEITDYTKSNVLLQAAQSMLAQANHNSSDVLSLLQ